MGKKKQIKKKKGKWGQGVTTGLACFVGRMCMASALKKSRIEVTACHQQQVELLMTVSSKNR